MADEVGDEILKPDTPAEIEANLEQEVIPNVSDEVVGDVGPQLAQLVEAAEKAVEPETLEALDLIMEQVQKIMDMGSDKAAQAEAYKKLWKDHPELVELISQLHEVDDVVKAGEDEAQTPESILDKTEDEIKNLTKHVDKGIKKGVEAIMKDDKLSPEAKEAQLREYLQNAGFPPENIDGIVKLMAGDIPDEEREKQVNDQVEKTVKENPKVLENAGFEIDEVRRLMKKVEGVGVDKTQTQQYREAYTSLTKATDELLDDVPVEDFIDLVFATGHGYGGFHGGRYDRWKENPDDEKEKKTLGSLGEILSAENPQGAKEFFAKFTDTPPEEVFADGSLLRNLESILNSMESDDARKEVKKKMSEAIEHAVDEGGQGEKLKPEDINLSQDVLRYLLVKAKENLRKKT